MSSVLGTDHTNSSQMIDCAATVEYDEHHPPDGDLFVSRSHSNVLSRFTILSAATGGF